MPKKDNPYQLTDQQILFCNYFVCQDFFGNGFQSYCAAYRKEPKTRKEISSVTSMASKLLTNVDICRFITDLLDEAGLNDNFIDKQLLFVATQNENLPAKMSAIKEYNNLKSRIVTKIAQTDKDGNDVQPINILPASVWTKEEKEGQ